MKHLLFMLMGIFVAIFVCFVVLVALIKDGVIESPESLKMKDYKLNK